MKITRHIPGSVDMGDEAPETATFSTTEELLEVPFVKRFSEDKTFSGYAMSEGHLMATYKNGAEWWVIGSIDEPSVVALPKWEAKKPGK